MANKLLNWPKKALGCKYLCHLSTCFASLLDCVQMVKKAVAMVGSWGSVRASPVLLTYDQRIWETVTMKYSKLWRKLVVRRAYIRKLSMYKTQLNALHEPLLSSPPEPLLSSAELGSRLNLIRLWSVLQELRKEALSGKSRRSKKHNRVVSKGATPRSMGQFDNSRRGARRTKRRAAFVASTTQFSLLR